MRARPEGAAALRGEGPPPRPPPPLRDPCPPPAALRVGQAHPPPRGRLSHFFTEDSTHGDAPRAPPPARPLLLSVLPQGPLLTPPAAPFPPPGLLPAQAHPLLLSERQPQIPEVEASAYPPPPQGPTPQSPGSCGGPKALFSAARLGLGSWDLGAIGLLRCEGAGLTSPKVSSILDTPVGDSGQMIGGLLSCTPRVQSPPPPKFGWVLSGNNIVCVGCLPGHVFPNGKLEGGFKKGFTPSLGLLI